MTYAAFWAILQIEREQILDKKGAMQTADHHRLLVKLARLYYEQELTQGEIAQRLRLSRQKVQRLVRQAREKGIVQIIVRPLTGTFSDIEKRLEDRYQLREAIVVETTAYDNQSVVAREVGVGAADYLRRVIRSGDSIVISWGESLLGMVNALSFTATIEVERTTVIQGLGGLADPNEEVHAADLTRRLAKALRAQAFLLPAPAIAASYKAREAFYSDAHHKFDLLYLLECQTNDATVQFGSDFLSLGIKVAQIDIPYRPSFHKCR